MIPKHSLKSTLRSRRLRDIQRGFMANSAVVVPLTDSQQIQTPDPEVEYASYFASIDAPAVSLCFNDRSLDDQVDQLIPSADIFGTYTSNEFIRSAGYRSNWEFPRGTSLNLGGYFIYRFLNQWTYYEDRSSGDNWVDNCAVDRNSIGKGAYTIVQTSRHINELNDPDNTTDVLGGSISIWIINTLGANTIDKQKELFPNLIFQDDEPIYYLPPLPSPLVFPNAVTYSVSRESAPIKAVDFIKPFITNTSTVVDTDDFIFFPFESSDQTIAKINDQLYNPVETITFIASGTFTLTVTQRFYQSYTRQISYSKTVFNIQINLTVDD
jgi:hypothetical protein